MGDTEIANLAKTVNATSASTGAIQIGDQQTADEIDTARNLELDVVKSEQQQTKTADEVHTAQSLELDGVNSEQEQTTLPPQKAELVETTEPPYTVLEEWRKVSIIITASFLGLVSPISSSTYLPSINQISGDLHKSIPLINLTVTTYMIFQGIAPSFVGSISDAKGRRPAYICCLGIYLAANIGLALQSNYVALLVLRCVQSSGSSGTIALASALVADITTRAERGKYIGYATMGVTLGPAIGPIIGGAVASNLGWHWIFWVLSILGATLLLVVVLLLPETCRSVVGNGSIPPPKWNRPLFHGKGQSSPPILTTLTPKRHRPGPMQSLELICHKEAAIILLYSGLMYAGYFLVLSTLTSQLAERYSLRPHKIGLCYLPIGIGSLTSRWTLGILLDRNFRRIAAIEGIPIVKNKQQDIDTFPIEKARLQVSLPFVGMACLSILAYGWVMENKIDLAGPLVALFFLGHFVTGSFSSLNTLMVDLHFQSPATATASSNLVRCLLGAGATGVATPMINAMGIGWTGTFVAAVLLSLSPFLWLVYINGWAWRRPNIERKRHREERARARLQPSSTK
ncbi:uncharacterized protein A1O9_00835 [Exophiala aquamarina CBS 119918]|uniref:Citrate exporter 1 n=1 Tax=Exophiala aquamarina CBS 119918 TaxID=1182545 RepID=A0A072PT04_9EURO|nr:uncharacterized protein A1O9_00835 [Exophiala aquamarina CBS 119918]KEF62862.1 hypothetical protein A1O9_00835 [Exophiala aquamarina CBS 119918]